MKKLLLLLFAVLFLTGCVFISPEYTGVRVSYTPVVYGHGYSYWNPMWSYNYLYGYYPYWQRYRYDRVPVVWRNSPSTISKKQIRKRPQIVTIKSTRSAPATKKTKITGKVVKKK